MLNFLYQSPEKVWNSDQGASHDLTKSSYLFLLCFVAQIASYNFECQINNYIVANDMYSFVFHLMRH